MLKNLKSAFLPTMCLGCVWKWIRSCKQNSMPESRRTSLQNVMASFRSITCSMVASSVASLLWNRPWNRQHNFFVLRHPRRWGKTTQLRRKIHPKPLCFLTALTGSRLQFSVASDRNHANRPNDTKFKSNARWAEFFMIILYWYLTPVIQTTMKRGGTRHMAHINWWSAFWLVLGS